jgi:ribosomal subunit interface protein
MNVTVSGQQLEIGSSLQDHVLNKLTKNVKKFFKAALSAHVVFSKQRYIYHCHIKLNEAVGAAAFVVAKADSNDIYISFDSALIKLGQRLRTDKRRLKQHQGSRISELEPLTVESGI